MAVINTRTATVIHYHQRYGSNSVAQAFVTRVFYWLENGESYKHCWLPINHAWHTHARIKSIQEWPGTLNILILTLAAVGHVLLYHQYLLLSPLFVLSGNGYFRTHAGYGYLK